MLAFVIMIALFLPTFAGTAKAFQTGYVNTAYPLQNAVTYDGKWTNTNEWVDAMPSNFGTNAAWREKYELLSSGTTFTVYDDLIIETWDNTNDAGDYYQICIDSTATGGSTPLTSDYIINITGHSPTATVQWYQGTGTAWTTCAAPTTITWGESLAPASPTTTFPHYTLEMQIDKTFTTPELGMRVAYYDAHAGGYGLQAWPPTSADVPSNWGDIPYDMNPIPESLNLGFIIALSSVAIIAGSVILQKRSKIAKFATKTV